MKPKGMMGQYAGFVTRAGAFILDLVIVSISVIVVNWLVSLTLGFFGIHLAECTAQSGSLFERSLLCVVATVFQITLTLMIGPIYYIFFWSLAGQTVGKYFLGVRIVRLDGKSVTVWTSLVRYIGYFVSILALGLGFLWVLLDDRRQGFHDKLARTCVIYAWPARQNETLINRIRRWLNLPGSQAGPAGHTDLLPGDYDLLLAAVTQVRDLRRIAELARSTMQKAGIQVAHTAVWVKDADGVLTGLNSGESIADRDGLIDNLLGPNWRIERDKAEQMIAAVPPDSFILALIIEERWVDILTALLQPLSKSIQRQRLQSVGGQKTTPQPVQPA